jgi:hypothetical protein
MPALEIVTPLATFSAYLDVQRYLSRETHLTPFGFSAELDRRIDAIQRIDAVSYTTGGVAVVVNRVTYRSLRVIVDLRENYISIYGHRKRDYSCGRKAITDSARANIQAQIGEMLLEHAAEHLEPIRAGYLNQLFDSARQQVVASQKILDDCLRQLEVRKTAFRTP